jgi:hypothetical protein
LKATLWRQITNAKLPDIDLYAIADGEERVRTAGRIHRREEYKEHLEGMLHWHVIAFYSRCRNLQPTTANDSNLRDCFANGYPLAIINGRVDNGRVDDLVTEIVPTVVVPGIRRDRRS